MPTIEIDDDIFNNALIEDMVIQYNGIKSDLSFASEERKKKLLKALKRVIEYYGGSVSE